MTRSWTVPNKCKKRGSKEATELHQRGPPKRKEYKPPGSTEPQLITKYSVEKAVSRKGVSRHLQTSQEIHPAYLEDFEHAASQQAKASHQTKVGSSKLGRQQMRSHCAVSISYSDRSGL